MPATAHLYAASDDARADLAVLDRKIAECKDACRAAILRLGEVTHIHDRTGLCFASVIEAIDDLAMEKRDEIRDRIEEADIAISDAEYQAA